MATERSEKPAKDAPPGGFGRAAAPGASVEGAAAPEPPTALPPPTKLPSLPMRMAFSGAVYLMFALRVPILLDAFRHCATGQGSALLSSAAIVVALGFGAGTLYTTLPRNFPSWDAQRRILAGNVVFWAGFSALLVMVLAIFSDLPMHRCAPPDL